MTKMRFQATGFLPVELDVARMFGDTQMLEGDKRGVSVVLLKLEDGGWAGVVNYLTTWGTERPFVSLYTDLQSLEVLALQMRSGAEFVLPPGAGFPAMPQFATRQKKLEGMMQTLTLNALTNALAKASEAM